MFDWLLAMSDSLGLTLSGVAWTVGLGVGLFIASIIMVTVLIVYLPANYFLSSAERGFWLDRHPVLRWTMRILKNLLGVVLVVAGAAMLIGPGQGILTILIGVMLLDFPGRRWLELKLLARPSVINAINRIRARFKRPPMHLPEPTPPLRATSSKSSQRLAATAEAGSSS